jgi:carbamoyltransferase
VRIDVVPRNDSTYILGVNTGPHDASAVILKDGEPLFFIEQERLSRSKRAFGEGPADCIRRCLDEVGLPLSGVAQIAVGWDVPTLASIEHVPFDPEKFRRWLLPPELVDVPEMPSVSFVPHHLAHAACAFWTSGFDEASILVIDGRGETDSTTLAYGTPLGISVIEAWGVPWSLGNYYAIASEWAGFTMWDAGKLMGLASYGQASQPTPLQWFPGGYNALCTSPDAAKPHDAYMHQRDFLYRAFDAENYPYSASAGLEPMAYAGFAASIQASLEETVLDLARYLRSKTSSRRLVFAGGVALNCTLNGRLARESVFSEMFVPPVPHDAGVSLGAALYAHSVQADANWNSSVRLKHAYLGPSFDDECIVAALDRSGLHYTRLSADELGPVIAAELARGSIVGWFQGRAEIGQRALGARSILCDPRHRRNLAKLNSIKGREIWRPLAPSVLEEDVVTFFGSDLPSMADFMLAAWPVSPHQRSKIPAAVHVDGSARPQVVRRSHSPAFWSLISAFRVITGVGAIINTSFNLAGEPIVLSPTDAVAAFQRSDMDVLVMNQFVVRKQSPNNMVNLIDDDVRTNSDRSTVQAAYPIGSAFLPWELDPAIARLVARGDHLRAPAR